MDKKILFNKALTSLVEFSATKSNKITMEDVKSFFKDLIDDESQYQFIYDYLAINKIDVQGFTPTSFFDTTADTVFSTDNNEMPADAAYCSFKESEEELAFIEMYMSDMNKIEPLSESEKSVLIEQLLNGDVSVSKRLIESHLTLVADIAQNHRGKGVTFGDLIQEGNIGLMVAVSDYSKDCGSFDSFINRKINESILNTINEQVNSDRIGRHLADKLNLLDKTTKELNEKLGRIPDITELSETMGVDEDEVSLLLKTSLDTLSVNQDTDITDSASNGNGLQSANPSLTAPTCGSAPLTWRHSKSGK